MFITRCQLFHQTQHCQDIRQMHRRHSRIPHRCRCKSVWVPHRGCFRPPRTDRTILHHPHCRHFHQAEAAQYNLFDQQSES